ncbi:glycoside hydrolase family 3 C-terminal domain-containing protein [Qipengyuania flava]|nr:glycoside hydrolase family 3 C-terminal domain-containing protein [Qipengyuania flava]
MRHPTLASTDRFEPAPGESSVTWRSTEVECERVVADLLALMTPREKAGQLVVQPMPPADDRSAIQALEYEITKGRVGTVTGVSDFDTASRLQNLAQNESRLGIPLFFPGSTDHGLDTDFPAPLTMAASWDLEAIENAEKVKASEARSYGINWSLGPTIELATGHEEPGSSSGSDVYLAAEIAIARIAGLQSPDRRGDASLLACLELSRQSLGSDGDAKDLMRLVTAIFSKARVGALAFDGEDTLARDDYAPLVEFLRRPGAYDGLILPMGDAVSRTISHGNSAARWNTISFDMLYAAIESNKIPQRGLDEAARRLLRAKFRLGLLSVIHAPRPSSTSGSSATPTLNCETALECAKRCPILLRNSAGLLPLDMEPGGILVVGSAAQDRKIPAAGEGIATSVIDGFERLGVPHRFVSGLALRGSAERPDALIAADTMAISMACDAARRASTVIFVPSFAGEQTLGEASEALLRHLLTANPRLVLVTIGPVPIDPLIDGTPLPCVLHAGQLGTMSGHAIAELLTGEAFPVGRLPIPLPATETQGGLPFGHGLSYAQFDLQDVKVQISGARIAVSVEVSNRSETEAEQLVQLYVRTPSEMERESPRRLSGFTRVLLPPKGRATVDIVIEANALGDCALSGKLSVMPGQREIFVGFDSLNGKTRLVQLSDEVAQAIASQSRSSSLL